jgi:hypothetical protein
MSKAASQTRSHHKFETAPGEVSEGRSHLVALSQFCSNTLFTDVQHDASVTTLGMHVQTPAPQRRRITGRLRVEVIAHYNRGMSSRRVAATLGLGRTTVLEILKAAGVDIRPQGRKYSAALVGGSSRGFTGYGQSLWGRAPVGSASRSVMSKTAAGQQIELWSRMPDTAD